MREVVTQCWRHALRSFGRRGGVAINVMFCPEAVESASDHVRSTPWYCQNGADGQSIRYERVDARRPRKRGDGNRVLLQPRGAVTKTGNPAAFFRRYAAGFSSAGAAPAAPLCRLIQPRIE